MLRWCAYCQEFQGEVAPFNVFTTTHGICDACEAKGSAWLYDGIENSHRLRRIQGLLHQAGKTGDTEAAAGIIRLAIVNGVRLADILVGLITPLLYHIGMEWEAGRVTILEEQRFTSFCEKVFEVVSHELAESELRPGDVPKPLVFLMNARGNGHTLGVRILSLWLRSKGIDTREFHPPPSPAALVVLAVEVKPGAILVSLALEKQKSYVYAIAQLVEALPDPRPCLIVGGFAIKCGLIPPIRGAVFLESINGLDDFIRNLELAPV